MKKIISRLVAIAVLALIPSAGDAGYVPATVQVITDGAVPQYALVKYTPTATHIAVMGATDQAFYAAGVAQQAAAGAGHTISIIIAQGIVTNVISDGVQAIAAGDLIEPSASIDGDVTKGGDGGAICIATTAAVATAGTVFSCLWHTPSGRSGIPMVYFPGLSGGGVNSQAIAGQMWPSPGGSNVSLGNLFCWEMWGRIITASGYYVVSDGAGGAHALLWDGGGGNIFLDDGSAISFGCDDDPPPNVVSHFRVQGVEDNAGVYWATSAINGILCGRSAFPGGRTRATQTTSSGMLYIGGSDHQNAQFILAGMRAWDQANPWYSTFGPGVFSAFTPPRWTSSAVANSTTYYPVSLYLDATQATNGVIPDYSFGYQVNSSVAQTLHAGIFYSVPSGSFDLTTGSNIDRVTAVPTPYIVYERGTPLDPNNPYPGAPDRGLVPPAPPVGAKIYDSFSRPDQDYGHVRVPAIGSTESGSLGAMAYTIGCLGTASMQPSQWGIFNGRAVNFETSYPCEAYVTNDTADMDVRVDSRYGSWGNHETGIAFRVQDAENYWYSAYTSNSGNNELDTGYVVAGSRTQLSSVSLAPTVPWTTLRVTVSGDNINVYTDATLRASLTNSTLSGVKGVGLTSESAYATGGSDSLERWDNFTVY